MAIAFDASSGQDVASTNGLSFSHTCTGSNGMLLVSVYNASTTVTSVTYNSVAMTLIDSSGTSNANVQLYYLIAPTTGANTLVVSSSGGGVLGASSASYTGVKQSAQPDNSVRQSSGTSPNTTTLTTVADNCWTVLGAVDQDGSLAASTGSTARDTRQAGSVRLGIFDSNAAKTPPGSISMSVTGAIVVATPMGSVMASIAPFTNSLTRSPADSILNGASRATNLTKSQVLKRALSDALLNGASRLATVGRGLTRNLIVSLMNGAGRLATLRRNIVWSKAVKHVASWTKPNKSSTPTWNKSNKASTVWAKLTKNQ